MQALMDELLGQARQSINNPMAGLQPIKNAAVDNVNRNYAGVPRRLASQFAARGYGSSGSFGNSLYDTEFARGGDLSKLEGLFADRAIDERNKGLTFGEQLLNFGKGETTTSSGTGTQPGNMAGAGLSAAGSSLGNLSALLVLQKMLKGGGGRLCPL
jgi:hypothetical protein